MAKAQSNPTIAETLNSRLWEASNIVRDQVDRFSRLSQGNADARSQLPGHASEYLIKKFADATNLVNEGSRIQ